MEKGIHKFIDLSKLPRIKNNDYEIIDWMNSIGYKLYFEYEDIKDYIKIIDYIKEKNIKPKFKIEYKNKIYDIDYTSLIGCKFGILLGKIKKTFRFNIGERIKDDKRDITIIDKGYIKNKNSNSRAYKYKCNKCGFDCTKHYSTRRKKYEEELWISEHHLLEGKGCSCCASRSIVKGINDVGNIKPEIMPYLKNKDDGYTHTLTSTDKVWIKCIYCGHERLVSISDFIKNNFNCPQCGDKQKYPNKFMNNLLNKLNIEFEPEKRFNWCKYKIDNKETFGRYDFYIPSMNLIIEMDGGFHYKNNKMSGQSKEISQEIDKTKDKLALKHNLKIIRINCDYIGLENRFEYIKRNTIKELNNIFDLDNIDWEEINAIACSNLVLKACQLKNNNPELFTTDIGKILGCNYQTIIKWLKIGNKLGWCKYNPKEELRKTYIFSIKSTSKQLEIFDKEGQSLGVFESALKLSRESKKIFGTYLNNGDVSKCLRGEKNNLKGYTFKYISREEYERRISEDPTLKESEQE